MKLSGICWMSILYIEAISAFTSRLSSSSTRKRQLTNSILNVKPIPHPPDFPPRIDEQLELDLTESQRRVMLYEKEVEMIREQLELKQDELLEEQNIFRDEKRNLIGKIAEFTIILSKRDSELAAATTASENPDLAKVVESLQTQLKQKTASLEDQMRSSEELRNRFDDAEDALEFEQMNFEKERNALQELVTEERKQVKAIKKKFDENSKSFEKIEMSY